MLTHFGSENTGILMESFYKVGQNVLKDLLQIYSAPLDKKTLKKWKMKEASLMIDRSESYLRKLEASHPEFKADTKNNIRYYSLELINKIRDFSGKRYKRPIGSKPIILAVSNFKGGVAKSTTSLHLAHKAAIDGFRVLCVDLDPQATLTLGFGYIPDLHLTSNETIKDSLLNNPHSIKSLIKNTYFDGIDIIPGNLGLSEVDIELSNIDLQSRLSINMGLPDIRLLNAINCIADLYDIIILDCAPNVGMLTINAATAANALLVPVPPVMSDLGSFITFTGTLAALFHDKSKILDFFRIVLTKHPESKESMNIQNIMNKFFGNYLLNNHIVNSVEIEKSSAAFGSIYEMTINSNKSYKRSIDSLNKTIAEILDAFKTIWNSQSSEINNE
ncbi:AAA family ATPase [Candidatus Bandiella numerosa]|uniref:AAA family ATPase n=1 Tax=Candidatus Bandiella numerosa TaxID=2570586 RepID=UPI001F34ADE3|nr:AAA family ATPase [Candidatus Bandiella numerosa]